jgi:hypothetical protein
MGTTETATLDPSKEMDADDEMEDVPDDAPGLKMKIYMPKRRADENASRSGIDAEADNPEKNKKIGTMATQRSTLRCFSMPTYRLSRAINPWVETQRQVTYMTRAELD